VHSSSFLDRVSLSGCTGLATASHARRGLAKQTDAFGVDVRFRKRDIDHQSNGPVIRPVTIQVKPIDHLTTKCTQLTGLFVFAFASILTADMLWDAAEPIFTSSGLSLG
jgi:hypothetical protein